MTVYRKIILLAGNPMLRISPIWLRKGPTTRPLVKKAMNPQVPQNAVKF